MTQLLLGGFLLSLKKARTEILKIIGFTLLLAFFIALAGANIYGQISNTGRKIAVDSAGNVYVTGSSANSETFNDYDYATIKYDPAGNELWVARYNGPGDGPDVIYDLVIDSFGNLYVTGFSRGVVVSNFATIKYDSNGKELWVARSNDNGYGMAVTLDSQGNVYVAGYEKTDSIYFDYMVIKYDSAGNELWVARYNGPANLDDFANSIAVDSVGNVYVTGRSRNSLTIGDEDYATVKYDPNGNELWVVRYNGPGNLLDNAISLAIDGLGNVCVTGQSRGIGTNGDIATIKYDPAGNELWVARYNGTANGPDTAYDLVIDSLGNVYVTGSSSGGITSMDYVTIKYDPAGNELWARRYTGLGGPDGCFGMCLVLLP